jgi:predicted patatin/cPLA2 family phospholipase
MELKQQGKVFVFTPKTSFNVGRVENDPQKLKRLYDHGYKHAKWAMNDLKKYLDR